MKQTKVPKTFVLDTNVILHDATCIHQFQEHNIVIPIAVIEEMDQFKRGNQVLNLNAREFARTLDSITGTALFNGGISLGKGRGKISIALTKGLSKEIHDLFREDNPDHRVLSAAFDLKKKFPKKNIILVSKDVNLRMKAKALSLPAEDYTTDKITNIEDLYSGKETIENFPTELINKFYTVPFELLADDVLEYLDTEIVPNKYFIFTKF